MKKLNKYLMLFVAAFALVGCVDDVTDTPTTEISAKVGDEVQFGLTLPSARTIYGTPGTSSFPIYWVDNDKVRIYSPQALEGLNNAEYKVSAKENQNFADNLTKTGDCGIQWGPGDAYVKNDVSYEKGGHDFYSVYPSGDYTFEKKDGVMWAKGVVVSSMQSFSVYKTGSSAIQTINHKGTMPNCLMTAVTPKESVDYENGVVNLKYTPRSTALWFTLKAQKTATGQTPKNITILGVELKATTPIAGAFDLNLNDGTAANISGSSSISLSLNDETSSQTIRLSLAPEESVSFPIFLAPVVGENGDAVSVTDWSITVSTDAGKFTKKFSAGDDQNLTLAPGKIHKITLPEIGGEDQEWDVSTWMKYIPRNVYLSEISIPGTWNSLNPEFQTKTSIDEQYSNGVRAFHFETRWRRTGSYFSGYNYSLGIADGHATGTSGSKYCTSASPEFSTEFNNIINKVQKDEYMVLVCSFAQGSAQRDGANGWIKVISELCENDKVFDARKLSSKTVVGDVLNKVIVIVNVESSISTDTVPSSTLAENSKCLFTYTPSEVPKTRFVVDVTDEEQKRTTLLSNNSDILWTTTTTTTTKSDIKMYSTQAQISSNGDSGITTSSRGYAPTLAERKNILDIITSWSKSNYGTANYAHDQWIYMGLGGYRTSAADASTVSGSHAVVENTMNTWVNQVVDEMGKNDVPFYPVGIVLMNNKKGSNYTDSNGTDLKYGFTNVVKNILLLNNKYRLQYDPTKPEDYVYIDQGTGGSGGSGGDEF